MKVRLVKNEPSASEQEAAAMRGDAAVLRNALKEARKVIEAMGGYWARETLPIIDAALSKPPRQCDIGTVEDQLVRFDRFCGEKVHCRECVLRSSCSCKFAWAQLPYVDRKKRGVTK